MEDFRNKTTRSITYIYNSGAEYSGELDQRGIRHGFGQMWFTDGTRYVGYFSNGMASEVGVMLFSDGSQYAGEFNQGWFHGHGVFQRADGMTYEGEFRGGRIWGNGLLTFADGTHGHPRHEGYFQDCKFLEKRDTSIDVVKSRTIASVARNLFE